MDKIHKDYPHATGHPFFGGLISNLLESINTDTPKLVESVITNKPISQLAKHPKVQEEQVASLLPATIDYKPASSQGGTQAPAGSDMVVNPESTTVSQKKLKLKLKWSTPSAPKEHKEADTLGSGGLTGKSNAIGSWRSKHVTKNGK
ncbi:uncharacterized protein PGTG_10488 [Puccinia graminis f. sp. tritici CRL 75-36-700-3]|uniref:Uncharacterized protein n=1 Tax=Puccinia graminis f. sp. tritici (strain CRL 75-36-700-3 / race SCCL) TaxID=418459 RepID=E3KII5_PUCGT|nr:uncharacterized protein PGTG_10488 [Puccinia graminis f. sp. tritici CRL 75-36-700-3]EFP84110.2 hypothetical protein PGTG_10488 [Puccinia graminis f. sp. tritici CRL 75-36-700-3]